MLRTLIFACAAITLISAAPHSLEGRVFFLKKSTQVLQSITNPVSIRLYKTSKSGVVDTPAGMLSIRAGTLDRFMGGVLINVATVFVHEKYTSFWNNVALLKLEKPLVFSNQIGALPLASVKTPDGSQVIISGWGRLKTGGDVPREMQWNTLKSISKLRCSTSILVYRDNMLCLAHEMGNGACNGDSGGPAIFNNELVGIAGFVVDGCGSSNPDGYAKVFYHRDWIIKHANL